MYLERLEAGFMSVHLVLLLNFGAVYLGRLEFHGQW
jgi:hypothetical protein